MDITKMNDQITNASNWLKNKSKLINIAGYVVLFLFCFITCSRLDNKNKTDTKQQQNLLALSDTIRMERLKNGNMQYSINGFIASEKELKDLNSELSNDVKLQKGKVISLNQTVIKLKLNEAELNSRIAELERILGEVVVVNDSTIQTTWDLTYRYDDKNYDKICGITTIGHSSCKTFKHIDTHLTGLESAIDLTFGQKIEDNQLRVFITSSRKGFSTDALKGVFIDPNTNPYIKKLMKKPHWFTGFGVGVGTTYGFDVISAKPAMVVGASLNYNIYQW